MRFAKILFIISASFLSFTSASLLYAQDNKDNEFNKAKLLMMEGKYSQSTELLKKLLDSDSTNSDIFYYLGLNYQSLSNFQMASKFLKNALKLDTGNVKIMTLLGNDYYSSGRIGDADSILSKAFSLNSTDSQILLGLGKTYKQEEYWDKAQAIYERLIKLDSANSFYYEQIAHCNVKLKKIDEAIINFQIAHRLNLLNQNTDLQLCELYISQDKLISASRIIDDGLKAYPSSSVMWTKKGDINLKMKNYDDAISNYHKSISLQDSSEINLRNMDVSYYWKGKYDSSVVFLNRAVNIMDKDPSAYFYLGASYKSLKEYAQAIDNLFKAVDLQRNDFMAETLIQIAATYYEQKNYSQALKYYQGALREKPDKKEITFYLAAVYDHYYKDKTVAIRYYKKFLADTTDVDKQLINYAKDRTETLIEKNHFRKADTSR
ncbi:MAG: tetratricopeptide repeat protein [Ignavibacteriaceae bacterium]